jgi:hypothetical protein
MERLISNSTQFNYEGNELEIFSEAANWKRYWSSRIRRLVRGNVIEVGAGRGYSTKYLCNSDVDSWLCLDPDPVHASTLAASIASGDLPSVCKAKCGVLCDLAAEQIADTILYIDVLEHIDRDEDELVAASERLQYGGHILVLAPAFNCLYSPFDKAIGHFRRYGRHDASRLTVGGLVFEEYFYLDSVGFFLSLANRLLLRSAMPSKWQIHFWDRLIVPLSVRSDRLFGSFFGKSIVMIWCKKLSA